MITLVRFIPEMETRQLFVYIVEGKLTKDQRDEIRNKLIEEPSETVEFYEFEPKTFADFHPNRMKVLAKWKYQGDLSGKGLGW